MRIDRYTRQTYMPGYPQHTTIIRNDSGVKVRVLKGTNRRTNQIRWNEAYLELDSEGEVLLDAAELNQLLAQLNEAKAEMRRLDEQYVPDTDSGIQT